MACSCTYKNVTPYQLYSNKFTESMLVQGIFFPEVSHLQVQLDRHDVFIHVRHTSMHFADDRDAWIGHGVAACVMNIYLKWKKKEAESRITVWHCLQENGMMQTRNDDISGENEWDSCVLDGKWDRDANRRRDFVIKQISKVMDEVNHHALKGRWCNWYDNTRWWSPDAHARLKHRWGGAQAYEEDGEEKKKRKKKCGTAQWLVVPAVTWLVGGGVTCSVGRGRGRVPDGPTLLRSSSRARVRRSNCISCSRTDARRDAAFSHCSIHTEREDKALHTHCCIHSGNECMAQTHAFIFLSSISRHRQTHAWIKGTNENVSTGYYTQT